MAENKNDFKIDGVLYAKKTRTWESKAKGTSGAFYYYIIEIATPVRWTDNSSGEAKEKSTTRRDLVKFLLPRGFDMDLYSVGDKLTIDFNLSGREFERKDGSGNDYGLELKAETIHFTDRSLDGANPNRDKVFNQPEPDEQNDNDNLDNLPF